MRILFLGDIVGRSGRDAVIQKMPQLKEKYTPDVTIVNAENAAGGFGINAEIAKSLFAIGVDCLTTGNHIWDQKEAMSYISQEKRLLRPMNFPPGTPGFGSYLLETSKGKKVLVVNLMARLFMDPVDCPFQAIQNLLTRYSLGSSVDAIFIDFHGETSSEKMSFGHFVDGKVSAVVGTHTHIPTSDLRILEKRTAYQTDAGMCGDYNSVIGMEKTTPVQKFVTKMPGPKMTPAMGEATLCGSIIDLDDEGLAVSVQQLILGPHLAERG